MGIAILIAAEIFTAIIQINFCDKAFEKKTIPVWKQVMVWVFFYIFFNTFTYLWDMPFVVKLAAFLLPLFVVFSLLYEGSLKIKLIMILFLYFIGMLSEAIVCLGGGICGISVSTALHDSKLIILYSILSKLVWFMEVKIAFLFLKKDRQIEIKITDWVEVFFVPTGSIFIVIAVFEPFAEKYFLLKLTAVFLLLIINLFTFYSYHEMQEKALYLTEKKFLSQQVESYATQLQNMGQMWKQFRKYRHEMQQKSLLIQSYITQGKYDKIKNIYKDSLDILERERNIAQTGNISFDTIINYKAAVAEKNGISLKLDALVPFDMAFEEEDLYSLLGNLLDNAIEATEKVPENERVICISVKMSGYTMHLEINNPYTGILRRKGSFYLTTKQNENEHGIGLRMVQDIGDRHHGKLSIKSEMNRFHVTLFIYDIGR